MGKEKNADKRLKEFGITMADVVSFRKHSATLRRGGRSKVTKKDQSEYDEYAAAAKWKRQVAATEARKNKRASRKRKASSDGSGDTNSESSSKRKKRKTDFDKKRKGKMVGSDSSSGDDEEWTDKDEEEMSESTEEKDHADRVRSKLYKKLKMQQRENVIPDSKADFTHTKLEEYDMRYVGRSLCKMSRIRMDSFESDFSFGLDEILRPFRGLLELGLPYSDSVVKVFYSNLRLSRTGVVSTCVRGQTIELTEKKILNWLGVKAGQSTETKFSGEEMDKILLEGGTTNDGSSLYRPKQLPHKYRVLHYIYSRNFVNKGKHFTTLSIEDKQILTCLIKKKPFHMGKKIIDTMLKAATIGKKNMELPYPSLVSLILQKHKIWYLHEGEPPIWTPEFDEEALHRMRIPFVAKQPSNGASDDEHDAKKGKPKGAEGPSSGSTQNQSFEEGVAEVAAMFATIVEDKLAKLRAEQQSTLNQMEERMRSMAIDLKDLRDFIYLYATDLKAFAAFKAEREDMPGPSTKPTDKLHSTSNDTTLKSKSEDAKEQSDKHASSVHGSPMTSKHSDSNDEDNEDSSKSLNSETNEDHDAYEVDVSSTDEEGEKEVDDDSTDSEVGDDKSGDEAGEKDVDDKNASQAGQDSSTDEDGEKEVDDDSKSEAGYDSSRDEEGEKEVDDDHASEPGNENSGEEEGEKEEDDDHASQGGNDRSGDETVEEEVDAEQNSEGTDGRSSDEAAQNEGEDGSDDVVVETQYGREGVVAADVSDDVVGEGRTSKEEGEADGQVYGATQPDAIPGEATTDKEGVGAEDTAAEEDLEPITQLSIVPLPEPVNPPPAPSSNITDVVPLRFIPASSLRSVLAAENLPHVFAQSTPIPPPSAPLATPMFIPVNLPGSQSSSPRRAPPKRSPSKKQKKN